MMFPYFFSNIHEIANFAKKIICIFDHEISFHLVSILVVYDT